MFRQRSGFGRPGVGWWMVVAIEDTYYRATRITVETANKLGYQRTCLFTDWPGLWLLRPFKGTQHTLSVREQTEEDQRVAVGEW